MTDKDVKIEVQRIETGGKDGKQMSAQQMQSEVTQIHEQMKTDPAAYRAFIDSVYHGIKTDAGGNGSLAGLLPVMDITDASVDAANVGNDRGNFSGQDGLSYGNVQFDTNTKTATSWNDGQNGITTGPNGTLNSFDVRDGGVHVQGIANGGQPYDWSYAGATVQPTSDGTIKLNLQGGSIATLQPDGSESVQMPNNGPIVTRPCAGSKVVSGYNLNGKDLIANGQWTADAPDGLKNQPLTNFEIDPKTGNVTKKGDSSAVIAKVSDGKLVAGGASEQVQGPLPDGVKLPEAMRSGLDRNNISGYKKDGDNYTATLKNGDTITFTNGKDDFSYTPKDFKNDKGFHFYQNDKGGWLMRENRDGADEISIDSPPKMDNGIVKYSQRNFLHLPSAPEKLTKDGSVGA